MLFRSNWPDTFSKISESHIDRNETEEILNWIRKPLTGIDKPILLVVGNAGTGKTVILKDVLTKLYNEGVAAVALKADLYSAGDFSELKDKLNIPDDFEKTKLILKEATEYDAIITSGGVSVGRKDFVIKAIEAVGQVLIHKVRTRPGKPIVIGLIDNTPIFALPGKPTGSFVATELNLRRYFLGDKPRSKVLCECVKEINLPKGRDGLEAAYIAFVHLRDGRAYPLGYKGSSIQLFSSKSDYGVSIIASSQRAMVADGYVITDKKISEGEVVEVNLF